MSVILCQLMRRPQGVKVDAKRGRTYTHKWLVKSNDPTDGPGDILLGAATISSSGGLNDPLPSHWSSYTGIGNTNDPYSYLQEVSVDKIGDEGEFYHWEITGTWKPPEPGRGNEAAPENPLDRRVRLFLEAFQFERQVTRDIVDDRLIVNSAGDLYDDLKRDDSRPILVAIKNEGSLADVIAKFLLYQNAVNTDTFYGAPPGCAKVDSIQCSEIQVENGYEYYQVTYRIQFTTEDDPFNLVLENKGNMAYDRDKTLPGAQKARVINLDGPRKGEPRDFAYLDYDGTQLADDADPLPMPDIAGGEDPYRVYPQRAFAGMGIGTSIFG